MTQPPTSSTDVGEHLGRTHLAPRDWLPVLFCALIVRVLVAFWLLGEMPLQSDALQYSNVAKDVLENFPGSEAYFWPPGLLYYLAGAYWLLGDALWVSRAAMILLGVSTTYMVVRVAWAAFESRKAAIAAGLSCVVMYGSRVSMHSKDPLRVETEMYIGALGGAMLGFLVPGLFLSVLYYLFAWYLSAFAIALDRGVRAEVAARG